jgi:oxygen-dependent protoporphyrinogen oxidase
VTPSARKFRKRFAVVGSGISGISAAFNLERDGHEVELFERDIVLGGRFGIDTLGGRLVMTGGKNIGRNYTALRGFLSAMGSDRYEPFGINTSRVIDGRLMVLDNPSFSDYARMATQLGSVRDMATTGYLASHVRAKEKNRFLGSDFFVKIGAKHDHLPLSAHFGPALTRNLLRVLTIRMNGAEPDEVYLGTFGTNLALAMDSYDQLADGIQPALDAFARRITVHLESTVTGLVVREGAVIGIEVSRRGGPPQAEEYDGIVLATPACVSADIVKSKLPILSEVLSGVTYFPATIAIVEYDQPMFNPKVRAIALDDGPCSNVGAYGTNDLNLVRYTFSGRTARELSIDGQLDRWIDDAERIVQKLLDVQQSTRIRSLTRQWSPAYCAYQPYHGDFLSKVLGELDAVDGLRLAGDYLRGASLEACFRSGAEAAQSMLASS